MKKKCRWCKAPTIRHCGICLECCQKRDASNLEIDAGRAPYIPPERIVGHRFYERKRIPRIEAQQAAANRLGKASKARFLDKETAQPRAFVKNEG